jgi:voltage-gated potassium channel
MDTPTNSTSDLTTDSTEATLVRERWKLLQQLEDWLEIPMIILGFVWLALLVVEFIWGLIPLLEHASLIIWIIFILDFVIKFTLAPRKLVYLRQSWLTVVALAVPALRVFRLVRVFRILQAARAARGLRLVRVITSLNRGMRALSASMGRRGFGYVIIFTLVVTVAGAAAMFTFENQISTGLTSYSEALWWTAMIMTTMGSGYWPQTPEGRVLAFLLSLYAFTIFGYVTAALATFFVGRDAESEEGEVAGVKMIEALHTEIIALRAEVRALRNEQRAGVSEVIQSESYLAVNRKP